MRLLRYQHGERSFAGVLEGDKVHRVDTSELGSAADDLLAIVRAWDDHGESVVRTIGPTLALQDVRPLAPFPRPPRNIFCVGKNYAEHADEFAGSGFDATGGPDATPSHPIIFTKPATSIIGPGDLIDPHTSLTSSLDYEAEIAVVIGRGGRNISRDDAWRHVWGYTLVNDITARDLQQRHKQWFLGKSLDTFCPQGPWAVSADEVRGDIVLESRVNGELRQQANTRDLIFDIPTLIHTLSAGITLQPGDMIATGTPAGVGIGFDPPRFLAPGDVVSVSADGLGTLTNEVARS
jgi:2-keto-4-pentenoate hydratase/2-oxohepta-3-ene-1,7-dioic acid hydratase in catechol pathway